MKKKVFILILLAVLILPSFAFAETPPLITTIVESLENLALYLASAITVILWIITGILFLTAQGDPAKLNKAKLALFSAIGGTFLVIIAGSAIALVQQALGL